MVKYKCLQIAQGGGSLALAPIKYRTIQAIQSLPPFRWHMLLVYMIESMNHNMYMYCSCFSLCTVFPQINTTLE